MERGPMALFGAIIAVGLGPAMWLGAQFGQATGPTPPPVIGVESTHGDAPGHAGSAVDEAGLESADRSVENRVDRRRVAPDPTTIVPVVPSLRPTRTSPSIPADSSPPPPRFPSIPPRTPSPTVSQSTEPSVDPSDEPDDPTPSSDAPVNPGISPAADPSTSTV